MSTVALGHSLSALRSRDVLHVFALSGFAIAQPIFALLDGYPTFIIAYGAGPLDIVALTLVLVVGPPIVMVALGGTVAMLMPRAYPMLHLLWVGLLAGLALRPALRSSSETLGGAILVTGLCASVFALLYARVQTTRTLISFMSPAPIVFATLFLSTSNVTPLLADGRLEVAPPQHTSSPVVVIVFDELPMASLLTPGLDIDPSRFPTLHTLAEHSDQFPHAYAVSDATHVAMPSILTGQYPPVASQPPANAAGYPKNLFSLFGESDVLGFETSTQLCPLTLCELGSGTPLSRFQRFAVGTAVSYLGSTAPDVLDTHLPRLTDRWAGYDGDETASWSEQRALPQLERVRAFTDFLRSAPSADLYFLHLMLPHRPWQYMAGGTRYQGNDSIGIDSQHPERWQDNPYLVRQGLQRHLLQLQFADRLLDEVLTALRERGLYDDALLIVTADHGMNFTAGEYARTGTAETFDQLMPVPLFIKLPHQTTGRVLPVIAQSVDILPTIADELDIVVPWGLDGVSVYSHEALSRKGAVFVDHVGPRLVALSELDVTPQVRVVQEAFHRDVGGRDYPAGGEFDHLLGSSVQDYRETQSPFSVDVAGLDLEDQAWRIRFAFLTGAIRGACEPDTPIALAINDEIVAIGETYADASEGCRLSLLLPEALQGIVAQVGLFIPRADGSATVLETMDIQR